MTHGSIALNIANASDSPNSIVENENRGTLVRNVARAVNKNSSASSTSFASLQRLAGTFSMIFSLADKLSAGGSIAPSANPLTMMRGANAAARDLVIAARAALLTV